MLKIHANYVMQNVEPTDVGERVGEYTNVWQQGEYDSNFGNLQAAILNASLIIINCNQRYQ
jgi:hypothetical protein